MRGGALACPTSDESNGDATLRITKQHDMDVARNKNTQETTPQGMTQKITAGKKGTKEYPYIQTHSTSSSACIDIH